MVATVPVVTNWSVTPQNGQVNYFTLMNTWLFESTSVIASLNTAINKINEAGQDINNIGINAINAITLDTVDDLATYTGTGLVMVKEDGLNYIYESSQWICKSWKTVYSIAELEGLDVFIYSKAKLVLEGRSGDFIYDATHSAVNNGGTIFDGWVRQFSGAVNVKWFVTTNNSLEQSVNDRISNLHSTSGATGGVVFIPEANDVLSETITIDNELHNFNVDCISLIGSGRQSSLFDATSVNNGILLGFPIYNNISDFGITNAISSGVKIDSQSGSAGNRNQIKRVTSDLNGLNGFEIQRSYMSTLESCDATNNSNSGFFFNNEVHTSWNIFNNYALLNAAAGFRSENMVYSHYSACGSDNNQHGYQIFGNRGVKFTGCGAESNSRAGWNFYTSSSFIENYVTMDSCLAILNNTAGAGWANHTHLQALDGVVNRVSQKMPVSLSNTVAGTMDFIATGEGSILSLEDPIMQNGGTQARSGGYIQVNYSAPVLVRAKTFTATQTVLILSLYSQLDVTNYSGQMSITAHSSSFGTTGTVSTATYLLLISKSSNGNQVIEIAKAGLTSGDTSSSPSFSFVLGATGIEATAIGNTAGSFWFSIEKISGDFRF